MSKASNRMSPLYNALFLIYRSYVITKYFQFSAHRDFQKFFYPLTRVIHKDGFIIIIDYYYYYYCSVSNLHTS